LAFGPFLLLEPAVREQLRAASKAMTLEQGAILIEERQSGEDAYLLLEGALRVVARGDDRTLAIVGAPALVGEMAAVQDQHRSATVVADTPCTVLRIPGKELRALMTRQPLFATAMRERADLLLADAFLKRQSPVRDLPAEIVGVLAARLRPRELGSDQVIEGNDDDVYLVRRGAIENLGDGARAMPGDFVQRQRGERYAAVGETWIYELRMSDVAREIIKHQERVREIAARLVDRAKVRAAPGAIAVRVPDLGGSLVHDAANRVVVSDNVGALIDKLDGKHDIATLVYDSRHARGEIVEGLAMLIAAGLADIRD
jgi:signal-transduction protein with cAMP-binding, CBS, and nucleotidyltransferase domain